MNDWDSRIFIGGAIALIYGIIVGAFVGLALAGPMLGCKVGGFESPNCEVTGVQGFGTLLVAIAIAPPLIWLIGIGPSKKQ